MAISLLPSISKIIEGVIHDQANPFLSDEDILYQRFIQAVLTFGKRHKKHNLLIEFSNSIFIKFYFKAYCR